MFIYDWTLRSIISSITALLVTQIFIAFNYLLLTYFFRFQLLHAIVYKLKIATKHFLSFFNETFQKLFKKKILSPNLVPALAG